MHPLSIGQLRVLDAVVAEGSLQAAAARLGRTHPTLHTALNNMEEIVGFKLLDRTGYRLELTAEGAAFLQRARRVLTEMDELQSFAEHIAAGEESELRVVIGDLSPLAEMLGLLRTFFAARPRTRLHLQFEALSGPWELLMEDKADLILHHVPDGDTRFETLSLAEVALIPVVAPGFLPFPVAAATPERMRDLVQCVIRDSASKASRSYFVLEGARSCTVSDQLMKREVILQGLGWGHMPDYLVAKDLEDGRLISFANPYFRGGVARLVAARVAGKSYGPVAKELWAELSAASQAGLSRRQGAAGPDHRP
jgi:DNA-binding transcriptional LysR family regulator